MGFKEGEIQLDSPTGSYYSGQVVNGRLVFSLKDVHKLRGIHLTVKGFCNVHWTTRHSRRVNDRTEHYNITHNSFEEYITLKIPLFGSKNAEHTLNPGQYDYPFNFQLPDTCPSSFEGSNGHVRYELRATMDVPYAVDKEVFREVTVFAPLDLNTIDCKDPVHFEFEHSFCNWCCTAGMAETVVKIPARGYCPGQTIPAEVSCKNRSNVEIECIRFNIVKVVTYHAKHEPGTRHEQSGVLELRKGSVPAHTDRSWVVELQVPDLDVHNMESCSFIDISYEFKVVVKSSGCHTDDDDSREIFFGTVPLVGFQDNAPPNPAMQSYPPVNPPFPPPMVNQPVSVNQQFQRSHSPFPPNPYPPSNNPSPNLQTPCDVSYSDSKSPYPGDNAPYPGSNSPYPPNNTPYPSNNSPYPTSNPPYPVPNSLNPSNNSPYNNTNPPYPVTNSPYPIPQNTPYPNAPSPFPVPQPNASPYPANSPYPTGNAPYPTVGTSPNAGNAPYPPLGTSPTADNAPYPTVGPSPNAGNAPYPTGNSPYPTGNAPYPNVGTSPNAGQGQGSSLKTGNLGFVSGGRHDSALAPLLPPGSVPFPLSPRPRSPFAGASAPAPATPTPTTDDRNPMSDTGSPYNPAFMGAEEKKKNNTDK